MLNLPDTALWAQVGELEPITWALLNLPHPEHPEAPGAMVPTPKSLRLPPEQQQPMITLAPPTGKAALRADRIMRREERVGMSWEFFRDLFYEVDSAAVICAAENFIPDAEFQFANYPPMVGQAAIAEFVTTLFAMTARVKHKLYNFWELSEDTVFTNGTVTFTRRDGTDFAVPFATVSQFNKACTLLIRHQVYVDASVL